MVFTACASGKVEQSEVVITILETSDIHGTIAPWDYATDSAFDGGLAKAATIIKQQRAIDPELLLIDCGDSVQDNMIQEFRNEKPHPMIKAMNSLGYVAWTLGNHEFNFEFENLQKSIKESKATVLAANIYKENGKRFVAPYVIKKVKGVRVAIIGITAPHVTRWEASDPSHYDNMIFTTPEEELGKVLEEIEGKADLVVCLCHYGEDGEYETAGMREVAKKYGDSVSAFFIGHAHSTLNEKQDNGTVILEPGSKCANVAKASFSMKYENGKWILVQTNSELIPVTKANVEADPEMMALIADLDTNSKALANTVVGTVGADFLPSLWWNGLEGIPTAIIQDTAMIDLINIVQMEETGADVSLAALFDSYSNLPKGDFRKRDGVKIYKYDNTLMAVKITGAQLKKIMEVRAGDFYNSSKPGDVTISVNEKIRLYNYDMFSGVDYDINISKPQGSRIENVMYKGKPLADDQVLVLAMNNYRYGGLSGAGLISKDPADLVYNSGLAIRDLISDYVVKAGVLMPTCDNNWKITGFSCDPVEAEKVYALVREGKITIPTSADGRTPNVAALNLNTLRAQGLIK